MNDHEHRGLLGGIVTGLAYAGSWVAHGIVSNLPLINEILQALATLVAIIVGFMTIRHYRLKDRRNKAETQKLEDKHLDDLRRRHNHRNYLLFWIIMLGLVLGWAMAGRAEGTNGDNGTEGAAALYRDAATNTWAATVAQDASRLVYDFLSGFSMTGVIVAYLASKGLRNYTPLGNAKGIGTLLRWVNLEASSAGETANIQTRAAAPAVPPPPGHSPGPGAPNYGS